MHEIEVRYDEVTKSYAAYRGHVRIQIPPRRFAVLVESYLDGLTDDQLDALEQIEWNLLVWEKADRTFYEQIREANEGRRISTLSKVILPIIRRLMPNVIANDIIGVQSMQGPVGQIFTMRHRYFEGEEMPPTETYWPSYMGEKCPCGCWKSHPETKNGIL